MQVSSKPKATKTSTESSTRGRDLLVAALGAFVLGSVVGAVLGEGVTAGIFVGCVFIAGFGIGLSLASDN